MLPGLSDASLSSPALSNLLALEWHNQCVCERESWVFVLISVYSCFPPPFKTVLPASVIGLSWPGSGCWCSAPLLSFHATPSWQWLQQPETSGFLKPNSTASVLTKGSPLCLSFTSFVVAHVVFPSLPVFFLPQVHHLSSFKFKMSRNSMTSCCQGCWIKISHFASFPVGNLLTGPIGQLESVLCYCEFLSVSIRVCVCLKQPVSPSASRSGSLKCC